MKNCKLCRQISGALLLLTVLSPRSAADPVNFRTPEFQASGGLAQIFADHAYDLGYSGLGTGIAVFDTGIDWQHPELAPNFAHGYSFVRQSGELADIVDHTGHGTHVAGIAAGVRDGLGMHGVAPGARVYSYDILKFGPNDTPIIDVDDRLFAGVDMMRQNGIRIANNSWVTLSFLVSSERNEETDRRFAAAIDDGIVFVFATGNQSDTDPWAHADRPLRQADLARGIVAVASVDQNNVISNFSNQCGESANWCVVAPGEFIYSSASYASGPAAHPDYIRYSGTSMATPFVSGTLALILEAFPWMTAHQLTETLFTTATEIGPLETYGRGLINAGAAVQGPALFDFGWLVDTKGYTAVFSHPIEGDYGLTKSGDGTLILNGVTTYLGVTKVEGGVLKLGDSAHPTARISGNALVTAGGIFAGHGTLGGALVNQGTVAPGGSIGTLTINGDYTQTPDSTLSVAVGSAGASRLQVDGTATLAGSLVIVPEPLDELSGDYAVLNARQVLGSFDNISAGPWPVTYFSYGADSLRMNRQAVDGSIVPALGAAVASDATLIHRKLHERTDAGFWADGGFRSLAFGAGPGHAGFAGRRADATFGATFEAPEGGHLGLAILTSFADVTGANGNATSGKEQRLAVSGYAGATFGDVTLSAVAGFGGVELDTVRTLTTTRGVSRLSANIEGMLASAGVQASWAQDFDRGRLIWQAGFDYGRFVHKAATETGDPVFSLAYGAGVQESVRPSIGVTLEDALELSGGANLSRFLGATVSQELSGVNSITSSLASGSTTVPVRGYGGRGLDVTLSGGFRFELDASTTINLKADLVVHENQKIGGGGIFGLARRF
ncbi:MAG: S8 family serine peptidase [Hoeflea sp.]|uniref:S8 family serine peptidase n=1 Tax=Hoeflea sp. TaxID=1940281 RepID=UPI003EF0F3BF